VQIWINNASDVYTISTAATSGTGWTIPEQAKLVSTSPADGFLILHFNVTQAGATFDIGALFAANILYTGSIVLTYSPGLFSLWT